jgi:hypothetical protein
MLIIVLVYALSVVRYTTSASVQGQSSISSSNHSCGILGKLFATPLRSRSPAWRMVLSRIELPGDMNIQLTTGLRYLLSLLVNYKVCVSLVSDSYK